ncbi:MAG: TIM barrel protein [Isosphaeraceae bacterium]|nr:TIM barrel protein [Isosphaeraceae bacterium]
MNERHPNTFPKLHNSAWPGIVGKGEGSEPPIDLETMLDFTAAAEVDGVRFDGIDLALHPPHLATDPTDDELRTLAERVAARGLAIGSVGAPVWTTMGGGPALDAGEGRVRFLKQVRKACRIAGRLRELGARSGGVVRIDSACSPAEWALDPEGNQRRIAETFREAARIARDHGERLAAEGEICWGGMHSWRTMVDLLERVGEPETVGFQADMAHTLLFALGENAPADRLLPAAFAWSDRAALDEGLRALTAALRPWTIDFHVAQNDATVFGSGSHDHTGRHCLPNDPNAKLDVPRHAGFWLRDEDGNVTKRFRHICWDGCMFPNAVLMRPETWNEILATMIAVRDTHGWSE